MSTTVPVDLAQLEEREVMPGFRGRFVHTDRTTLAFWEIDEGAELPEHRHPHEQTAHVLEGSFELVVSGEPHRLGAGSVLPIPSQAPHSGRAITACRILDVFSPPRDDYR
ncbi:MAG: cupin domain-containing protein [Acidobacteria bacterium]|nr:MAG: cupin domain-containing protein [Acidobacteriota bacterium]REK06224.1 MAG: cupin domain-containing protein [Acidobacteriota bacterium]